jgi:hypothetical protein
VRAAQPEAAERRLMEGAGFDERAARNLLAYLDDQAAATGAMLDRAQASARWWAAARLAADPSIDHVDWRQKLHGDPDEGYAMAMLRAAEMLLPP